MGLAFTIRKFIRWPPLAARYSQRKQHLLSHSPDSAGCALQPLWLSPAQIRCISDCITTEKQLTTYIKKYNINLVIQAADAPSTNQLAHIINSSCNENHIPYIINPGYMGNAVSLPEFFYSFCYHQHHLHNVNYSVPV